MRPLVLSLLGALVVGCAPSSGGVEPGADGVAVPSELAASMVVKVSRDGVRLALHVTNTTSRPLEFTFPTSQRYDFVVTRPSGEEVWRWSDGVAFLQAVSRATLAPGESWDMDALWDPEEQSGPFVAVGRLTARGGGVEQRTTFELP